MSKNGEKYEFLDLLKFISIIFVIVYHSRQLTCDLTSLNDIFVYFSMSIFSTSVPLFFFINGALLLNKDLNIKKHIKKILKISILTLIWSILTLLILELVKGGLSQKEFIHSIFKFKIRWNNHLWFMVSLLYIYIFFPIIKYIYDKFPKVTYGLFLLLFIFVFGKVFYVQIINVYNYFNDKNTIIYNVDKKLFPFVYFILGGILFKYRNILSNKFSKKSNLFLYLFILMNMIISTCYEVMISISKNTYIDICWDGLVTLTTFSSCICLFILSLKYKGTNKFSKTITFIGRNTIGLYFIHWIYIRIAEVIFRNINFVGNELINLLLSPIIIIISVLTVKIMKKIPILNNLIST
ncbi:MAG: acyltransferase [Clostridium sp.]|nr:acyltransferase [Clostridium sp.]